MSTILLTQSYNDLQRSGVACIVAASFITILAILCFATTGPRNRHPQTNIYAYFICLLVANTIQSVGTSMSVRWVVDSKITQDTLCSLQGAIKQLGNVSTAFWTFMIALHIFNLLFRRITANKITFIATVLLGWAAPLMVVFIGPAVIAKPEKGPYFGISGDWCWITDAYPLEQTLLEYLFEYLAVFLGMILYTLVLLRIRGNLIYLNKKWILRFVPAGESWQLHMGRDAIDLSMAKLARTVVWYPVAYTVILIPISLVRLTEVVGGQVPDWAFIPTDILYNLTGFVNVMLFILTHRLFPDLETLPDLDQPRQELSPTFAATGGVVPYTFNSFAAYGAEPVADSYGDEEKGFEAKSSKRFTVDSVQSFASLGWRKHLQ